MNNRSLLIIVFLLCATSSIAQQKIRHTVQEGETIESIAKKYNITVVNLKEANPDIDMFFYTGLKLNIPQIDRIITPLEQTDSQIVKNVLQYDMKVSVTDKKEQNLSKSNKRNSNVGESIQKINSIYSANFNVSNPVESYESTKTAIIDYIKGLGSNTSQQLQDYYYEAFYDASENEQLDSAVTNAFKYLMVEGKLEEDVMWKFLVENYACDGNTESTKFLLDCFKDVSVQHNNAYSIIIESLSTKYGDVIHPLSFDKMIKGYWISLNNKYQTVRIFGKDVTSNIYGSDTKNTPDFILQINNVLTDVGTTMLSSPRTPWKCKKTSGFWYYSPNIENYMMQNSQNTFCNADAKELSLTFASEKVKEGNTDRARQQIAENRQWQADMHGKIASSNTSFGNKLAGDVITDVATGFFNELSKSLAATSKTSEAYWMTTNVVSPKVMNANITYRRVKDSSLGYSKIKADEPNRPNRFVKWEESDSVIFISEDGRPIFMGSLQKNSSLLNEYNEVRHEYNFGRPKYLIPSLVSIGVGAACITRCITMLTHDIRENKGLPKDKQKNSDKKEAILLGVGVTIPIVTIAVISDVITKKRQSVYNKINKKSMDKMRQKATDFSMQPILNPIDNTIGMNISLNF